MKKLNKLIKIDRIKELIGINDLKELIPYVVILIMIILFRSLIASPVKVIGDSMDDTLAHKEVLILNKIKYQFESISRFDIVVIKEDKIMIVTNGEKLVKRIIGLPGEYVEYKNDVLYINGKYVEDKYANSKTKDFTLKDICNDCEVIPEGYYLVLGDNRMVSKDSRSYGLINKDLILGKTVLRIWPLNRLGVIDK